MNTINDAKKVIEDIDAMIAKSDYAVTHGYQEYWYTWNINEWEKHNKHRIYINLTYGRTRKGSIKWKRGCKFFIDLNEKKWQDVSDRYNNAGERHFCEEMCENIVKSL